MSVKDDDLDLLAAEYVLGTLEDPERLAFEQRLAQDAVAQARVQHWQQYLNALAEAAPSQLPPASVWEGIERQLGASATRPLRSPGEERDSHSAVRRGITNSLAFWKGASAIAASMVLVLSAVLGTLLWNPQPDYFVVVTDADARPLWVVQTPDQRQFQVRTVNAPGMDPMVCQLWLVWEDGTVTSLGVLPEGGEARLRAPRDMDRKPIRAQVVVTVEPPGGSPAPTGKLVYKGPWLSA